MSARACALALALLAAPLAARAAGEIGPGAYCPLPEEGQEPECLTPARDRYGEFFEALDDPEIEDAETARVEEALVGASDSPERYLALSTLSYGYYRLAQRASADPQARPEVVARLERWNALLSRAYDQSEPDEPFRAAVREAAVDIQRRAPPVRLTCADARGRAAECDSTEAVIRGIDAAGRRVGIRGALERVLERVQGEPEE